MSKTIRERDSISFRDEHDIVSGSGLWTKTEVIGGYDLHRSPTGKSTLGETLFSKHNMVPIGGVTYAMENLFGVKCNQFVVPTLYSQTGIGLPDSETPTESYKSPNGDVTVNYRYGHFVQLFGVGITGTAENDVTQYPVSYRENSINLSKVTNSGLTLTGTMVPFRRASENLSQSDAAKYFGKKQDPDDNTITNYYLKKFESDPEIKHVWKTGDDVEDESAVTASEVWENNSGSNDIESFTEIILKVSKKDVKDWFTSIDQEERTRINTIALFSGRYVRDESNPADLGDYQDVRLFSKLIIPVEYLSLSKDLNIIYRVYGS